MRLLRLLGLSSLLRSRQYHDGQRNQPRTTMIRLWPSDAFEGAAFEEQMPQSLGETKSIRPKDEILNKEHFSNSANRSPRMGDFSSLLVSLFILSRNHCVVYQQKACDCMTYAVSLHSCLHVAPPTHGFRPKYHTEILSYTFALPRPEVLPIDQRARVDRGVCKNNVSLDYVHRELSFGNVIPKSSLPYSLMYFFKPLSLSLACSNTSSSLQTANRNQSSAR